MTSLINASTSAGVVISPDTSGILQLQTAGTAAVTIDASQNVGIGTSSPAGKLHISGSSAGAIDGVAQVRLYDTYTGGSTSRNWLMGNAMGVAGYGDLTFLCSATQGGNPTGGGNNVTFKSSGAVVLLGGSQSATGTGITFPATQSASSDANTLDDYEEGTWTPVIFGTSVSGTGTYNAQIGTYTKIGRVVTINGFIWVTAHTGTGTMKMSGLPFTTTGDATAALLAETGNLALTANNIPQLEAQANSNNLAFIQTPVGGGGDTNVNMDGSFYTRFSCTYFVA